MNTKQLKILFDVLSILNGEINAHRSTPVLSSVFMKLMSLELDLKKEYPEEYQFTENSFERVEN